MNEYCYKKSLSHSHSLSPSLSLSLSLPLSLFLPSLSPQASMCLFQSEPYTSVLSSVEVEVETGRLAIRQDHSPHCDVGAREEIMQLLLSYNTIWLRLGLEVCMAP